VTTGLFITLEGGEGAGKSTQARRLADALRARGHVVVLTREPGGTPGAEAVRGLLLDPDLALDPLAETMLHFAARADHVAHLIGPALVRGAIVISDRYTDSTRAYQGCGHGVPGQKIEALAAAIGLEPDLTLVLTLDPKVAAARRAARGTTDRYELLDADFFARVEAGFRAIAAAHPARCVLVDADGSEDEVLQRLLAAIDAKRGGA
jgi:dTMP kinase